VGPYQPAEQAYLADSVAPRYRNDLFGRIAFMSSFGALIGAGPLAALPDLLPRLAVPGIAGHPLADFRIAFLALAALALLAGLLAMPISEPQRARPTGRASRQGVPSLRRISRQSWATLWRLWITNSVNGLAVGFFGPFITYWYYVRFHAGPAQIGLLYAAINLTAMASNLYAAPLARRLGLVRAIVLSRALQAALMIPMVLAPSFWLAGAFYLLRMLAQRVGLPLRQSYTMAVVPQAERGTVAALSNLPSQGTAAIGPSIAGELFAHVSLALPFEVGAALQGLNTLLFYTFFRRQPPPEERGVPEAQTGAPLEAQVPAVAAEQQPRAG
jgi:MFS family permease